MAEPITFYFDFSSPYGYLMSEKIDDLAARHGRKVQWRPLLLGVVFQTTNSAPLTLQGPAKAAYYKLDFARSARFLGVPFRLPAKFPLPTQQAARAYYWLHDQDCALARAFAHATYRALFVDDRDISSPEAVLDIAAGLGVDRTALGTALVSPEVKERLKTEVESALAAGVFGSPTVIVDGEMFFGADRLPQLERWLAQGSF
ncbi:MAG: 2-hydroxychromene-2-carboxylate isomerase [Azonexus sp.]|nr:2-hydroxychromene-2-carboxylate isomerase [Betaproteobacteria bacterium]MBK8919548.1 2-hydroxychromene-2-carboxylate isomerase [Betaproteobacteria bacterium]MBP6036316.1 2-hydroxychromene-2-carboxylate isomerase [Azonexus sp.]MBP6906820.1 2-hydroxychromene-2-carboxylate isomerase [Azonexus sp.]